jgi:sporulation protein YlmC with PRC-barrel domain
MDFHFGADVRGRDDERLGELRQLAFDPGTLEIVSLVVQHAALDERDVIVPIDAVDGADHGGVVLQLSRDQFERMRQFATERNVAPPPLADNLELEDNIEPENVPDVPSVGAATGVESIAFTPVIEEDINVPAEDGLLGHELTVVATDGEVGQLRDVRVNDQTRRIESLALENGILFKHEIDIPIDWVASIQADTIVLNVGRASLSENGDA